MKDSNSIRVDVSVRHQVDGQVRLQVHSPAARSWLLDHFRIEGLPRDISGLLFQASPLSLRFIDEMREDGLRMLVE